MNSWSSKPVKRRDRLYIMAEILQIAKDMALKTRILYRANLSFTQLNDYLGLLLEVNLLEKQNDKNIYKTTEKGLEFLQRYREITRLLRREEENCKINGKMLPSHPLRKVGSVVYISQNH